MDTLPQCRCELKIAWKSILIESSNKHRVKLATIYYLSVWSFHIVLFKANPSAIKNAYPTKKDKVKMMKNSARKVQRKSASHWKNSETINHSRTIPLSNRWHTFKSIVLQCQRSTRTRDVLVSINTIHRTCRINVNNERYGHRVNACVCV